MNDIDIILIKYIYLKNKYNYINYYPQINYNKIKSINKTNTINEIINKKINEETYIKEIENILKDIKHYDILLKDILLHKNWYKKYYSKTKYYRLRKKAKEQFIARIENIDYNVLYR